MSSNVWLDTLLGYKRVSGALLRRPVHKQAKGDRKHILILVWEFPPHVSGGVYRPAALARYMARSGWRVTVLCKAPPENITEAGQYLKEYVGPSVEYLYIQPSTLQPSYRAFPSVDGGIIHALDAIDIALTQYSVRGSKC